MLTIINVFKDEKGNDIAYRLQDETGDYRDVGIDRVIKALKNKTVKISNLKAVNGKFKATCIEEKQKSINKAVPTIITMIKNRYTSNEKYCIMSISGTTACVSLSELNRLVEESKIKLINTEVSSKGITEVTDRVIYKNVIGMKISTFWGHINNMRSSSENIEIRIMKEIWFRMTKEERIGYAVTLHDIHNKLENCSNARKVARYLMDGLSDDRLNDCCYGFIFCGEAVFNSLTTGKCDENFIYNEMENIEIDCETLGYCLGANTVGYIPTR